MNTLLQTAYKLQSNDVKTCYDIFKDFVFPSLILIVTIGASIWLAKKEFNRVKKHEDKKSEDEKNALKRLILRNINVVSKKVFEEIPKFRIAYIDRYKIEKAIYPVEMLVVFPELFTLTSIESLRYESIFIENYNDDESISRLYLTIGSLDSIEDSYDKIGVEVSKMNSMLSNYEVIILKHYDSFVTDIGRLLLEYVETNTPIDKDLKLHFQDLLEKMKMPDLRDNNFYALNDNIKEISESKVFELIVNSKPNNIESYKSDFLIYYFKLIQELSFYSNRVDYLIRRLSKAVINLESFLSNFEQKN